MKRKVVAMFLTAAMGASLLAGCGSGGTDASSNSASSGSGAETSSSGSGSSETGTGEDGDLLIYGIYKSGDQTWFLNEGAAAQAAVEKLGGTFIYVDVALDSNKYLTAIDNAIANQADGIVTCTPEQTTSQAVVDKCNEAGIPVVACDDPLETDDWEKLAPWVGIDGYSIGQANGEWLANYVNENNLAEDPEVGLLLMTIDTVSSCVPRIDGELEKFTELVPNFDESRIFRADNDGTTDKGNTAATAVITAHPEIKKWMVTGANEECCIGAVRALESAGLDAEACVVGLGAYMAKDEWNDKGADGTCMKASTYFSETQVGEGSIDVLMQLINGEEPPMETAVSAEVVTPENYKEVMGSAAD